jgi:hypothetical protein
MKALTLDDLLPLDEFADRRREFLESHLRYLDRYRRVRTGPRLTLLFENRQTLWFRLQDVLRIARLSEPRQVQAELDLYNHLLPACGRLQAALLVAVENEAQLTEELARWRELRGPDIHFHLGDVRYPATLLTCRPEDRCIGAAHWVQFALDAAARRRMADRRLQAHFSVRLADYAHDSAPLSDDTRQSLLDDLARSERED